MSARGFLGAGDLYIARYNPTTATFDNYKGPYEASKFEIKAGSEMKEMISRGRTSYGQVIETVTIPKPVDFTVELSEVNAESITIALLGTSSALSQGSGTVTDEVVAAKLGAWVQLAHQNLASAGLVVTNSAGSTTYVLGTDYNINYRMGMIQAITGGAISDAQSLKVDYTYNAIAGTKIAGATNSEIRAKFKLDGVNFADGLPVIVECYEGVVASDAAFDFLQSDFAKVPLKGRLKTPTGKTEPFLIELRDSAS